MPASAVKTPSTWTSPSLHSTHLARQRMSTTQELLRRRHRASVNPHKSDQLKHVWSTLASLIKSRKINSRKSDQHFISADHWSASVNLRKSERYHRYLTIDDPSGEVEIHMFCALQNPSTPHNYNAVQTIQILNQYYWWSEFVTMI